MRWFLPLLRMVIDFGLEDAEFRAWVTAARGQGAVEDLRQLRDSAAQECVARGW